MAATVGFPEKAKSASSPIPASRPLTRAFCKEHNIFDAEVVVVSDAKKECTIWERLATVSKALVNGREAGIGEEADLAMVNGRKNVDCKVGSWE
nr:hypothetical protein Iba_chr10aCG15930 [Ipomoea batatas]